MNIYKKMGSALRNIIYITLFGIIIFLVSYIYFLDNPNNNLNNNSGLVGIPSFTVD